MSSYINRRDFIKALAIAGAASPYLGFAKEPNKSLYQLNNFGDVRLLHFTDCHAQLQPMYFREPNVNIGVGTNKNQAPHVVGKYLLEENGINNPILQHAFSYIDFVKSANKYGRMGGFAHLATLIKQLRTEYGDDKSLLLDGGDTWQGSATSYWTKGQDMVEACNILGVDVMTGHWEFTYEEKNILENIKNFNGDFVAQNIFLNENAFFNDEPAFDSESGHVFPPYVIKNIQGKQVAIIGQSFPYTPIANPQRFIPNWSFGIREAEMQETVDQLKDNKSIDLIVLLSHNGIDVDKKMASKVSGIDIILGGHTHDAVVNPLIIKNSGGKTIVANSGSHGKFLSVVDIKIGSSGISDFKYKLLPIFSDLIEADNNMQSYINKVRKPYLKQLREPLAKTNDLLYRRGNFSGSFDQIICNALTEVKGAQISLSPGFRWGRSVLPGDNIYMEDIFSHTSITYPETYKREMSGENIKLILEDVADNIFNPDPYFQQGGDMVRVGGMNYEIDITQVIGKRISNLRLDNGKKIEANKNYTVAGWATVGSQSTGEPVWDTVKEYLSDKSQISVNEINNPKIIGLKNNLGIEDY